MKLKFPELSLIVIFVALAAILGYFFTLDASRTGLSEKDEPKGNRLPLTTATNPEQQQSGNTATKSSPQSLIDAVFAIPNERIVSFENEEDYRRFLASLKGSKIKVLGTIDRLRALRIGFDSLADLDGLLDEDQFGPNYSVTLPLFPTDGSIQFGAVGFNGNALQFLGIDGDNSAWGEGVTIAVIDSGISDHSGLSGEIRRFDLSESAADILNGHGTAVASLIAGQDEIAPGVAPASSLLDIRITDESGRSSSFQLAEGILRAIDEGADIINISLGSLGDSLLVQRAVELATSQGIVIVASSGNEGLAQTTFPAGYSDVVAVGAVDRQGVLVDFSNTGSALDITAPGLQVNAAWLDNRFISFSGTSASAPYVAASIAAVSSEFGLSATASRDLILANANENGPAGADVFYGNGTLDTGRTLRSRDSGIFDLASVSNFVTNDGNSDSLIAIVQNQGTAIISNASANVRAGGTEFPLSIPRLAPGEIQSFELPFTPPASGETITVQTSASLGGSVSDVEPRNNVRQTSFTAPQNAP